MKLSDKSCTDLISMPKTRVQHGLESKVYTVSAAMALAKAIERAMNMIDKHPF